MEPICEADDHDVASYWGVQVLGLVGCFVVCLCVWLQCFVEDGVGGDGWQ